MNIHFEEFKEYFLNTNMILKYSYKSDTIKDFIDLFILCDLRFSHYEIENLIFNRADKNDIYFYSDSNGKVDIFQDKNLILDEDVFTFDDIIEEFGIDNEDDNYKLDDVYNPDSFRNMMDVIGWSLKDMDGNIVYEGKTDLGETKNLQDAQVKLKEEKILNPLEIKEHLDKYVIGQNNAKESLSVAIYNHYKRIRMNKENDRKNKINKSNILMVGKSGTGKTLLVSTVAKILNVPFITVNATQFSPTGYVGDNVEDIVKRLSSVADENGQDYKRGIVFIDEIDKLSGSLSGSHDQKGSLSNETQASFLKLIEGETITAKSDNPHNPYGTSTFDTSEILFICAGAFDGIEDLVEDKKNDKSIGFNNSVEKPTEIDKWKEFSTEEIIKFGLMPELIGRLPVLLKLDNLTVDDFVKILTEPDDAITKEYKELFAEDNVELEITEEALKTVSKLAIERGVGARGLRGILDEIMNRIMFRYFGTDEMKKCIITKQHILDNTIPELKVMKNG